MDFFAKWPPPDNYYIYIIVISIQIGKKCIFELTVYSALWNCINCLFFWVLASESIVVKFIYTSDFGIPTSKIAIFKEKPRTQTNMNIDYITYS